MPADAWRFQMTLVFPTPEDLRAELEDVLGSDDAPRDSNLRDSVWAFNVKETSNMDPADAHGA
jgi:hypothetical protein